MTKLPGFLSGLRGPAVWTGGRLQRLPGRVWRTKGFEFWTFLSLLLLRSNCQSLLELGSGRSTLTLAEYAGAQNARLISIETSAEWASKARLELSWLAVADESVRLIGWDAAGKWYDLDQFRASTVGGGFDFALIDGPNDDWGRSEGMRDNPTAMREIRGLIRDAGLVLVDDVHRRHVLDSVDGMLDQPDVYDRWFYDYDGGLAYANSICICARKGTPISAAMPEIEAMLGMRLYTDFSRDGCPED